MEVGGGGHVAGCLVAGVAVGLAHEENREAESQAGVSDAEEERLEPQASVGGDDTGHQGGDGDGALAAASLRPMAKPRRLLRARGRAARRLLVGLPDWRLAGLPVPAGQG